MRLLVDDFGHFLKGRRMMFDMTIEDLADEVGVSKGYISRLENNTSTPSLETLAKMANVLHFPLSSVCDMAPPEMKEQKEIDLEDVFRLYQVRIGGRLLNKQQKERMLTLLSTIEQLESSSNPLMDFQKIFSAIHQYHDRGE